MVFVYNRQLHPDEKARIKQLAAGDPKKEARLTAAACALVKCYAEYPQESDDYKTLKKLADAGASGAFAGERAQLSNQTGLFTYSNSGPFSDQRIDAAKQFNNTYQIGTRLVGAGKVVLGTGGLAGSIVTLPASCLTGIGCYANGAVAVLSVDQAYAGAKELVFGVSTETFLNKGLQGLGLSPTAAAWVEAGLGVGSAATALSSANKAVDATIALNKAAAGTYRNPLVGDEPYSINGLSAGGAEYSVKIGGANGVGQAAGVSTLEPGVVSYARNGSRNLIDQRLVSEIGEVACGPTSCAMIMGDRGLPVNISNFAKEAGIGVDGTDVLGLTKALQNNGVSAARWRNGLSIDELATATSKGNSAIVQMDLANSSHFIVVDGVTKRAALSSEALVAVRDPWKGTQYFLPQGEFNKKFTGWGILTNPKKP